jgi:hypothetical protein
LGLTGLIGRLRRRNTPAISIDEVMANPMMFSICVHDSRPLLPAAKVFVGAIVDFCKRCS